MAKDQSRNTPSSSKSGSRSATLREQCARKKNLNPSSTLKLQHLQKLVNWTAGEASIPSLAALFGRRLSATAEAEGVPLDRSIFSCQRCETFLQPGRNCSIRIEKRRPTRNSKKGTPMGHLKDLSTARSLPVDSSSADQTQRDSSCNGLTRNLPPVDCPRTPSVGVDFCSSAKRKEETVLSEKEGSLPNKRRRRKWSTVKEIAMSSEREREQLISNLAIPFNI